MQELLAEENLVEAARLAHTPKGIAGSLGAKGLETASRMLKHNCGKVTWSQIHWLL